MSIDETISFPDKNVLNLYNLPKEIIFCEKCTISNQRPRITFNDQNICSACTYAKYKNNDINWQDRKEELIKLLDKYRKNNGEFDVIVPCSGGKDGSFVAHQLKHVYNMNPLCVTWSPLIPTDIGKKNLTAFINSGFHHIQGSPEETILRKLTNLSFIHLGDPFQPFIYGQTNYPLKIAVEKNIQLIFYGENGEVEYGGDMTNAHKPNREVSSHNKIYFSGLTPDSWVKYGISKKDLLPFMAPSIEAIEKNETKIHFLGYYLKWDPQENYYYCCENTGFTSNKERTEGTYSKYASLDDKLDGFHYYLSFIKFGIGRATSDTAHEIRDGKITREEGISLVRKYDGEFPSKYMREFLEFCNLSENNFFKVIDSWRSSHIWSKISNKWVLNKTIY